jgi:hypothetical protein
MRESNLVKWELSSVSRMKSRDPKRTLLRPSPWLPSASAHSTPLPVWKHDSCEYLAMKLSLLMGHLEKEEVSYA